MMKWGCPVVEGVLRLRLAAMVGAPAAGTDSDHPARPGASWPTLPASIRAGNCQSDAGKRFATSGDGLVRVVDLVTTRKKKLEVRPRAKP